jgi:hypothetical protein
VSIIHSSSLAYKPVSYYQPQPGPKTGGGVVPAGVDSALDSGSQAQASSTQQIKTALSNSGWLSTDAQNQSNNSRTQKALNAYVQNLNLSAKQHIADTISGIDTYA